MDNLKTEKQIHMDNIPAEKIEDSIQKLQAEFNSLKQENAEIKSALRKLTPLVKFDIQVDLVQHCNLSCFCCNHFSQLADEEYTDLVTYENDIKQLASIVRGGGQ